MLYIRTCCWSLLLSTLASAVCIAQTAPTTPTAAPQATTGSPSIISFVPEQNATLNGAPNPKTMQLDPQTCFPYGGPPYSLESPFEVYARPFAALNTGHGPLSGVLNDGYGVDVGARSFLFNNDRSAAWYGDLGIGYQYNDSNNSAENLIVRTGTTNVLRFGTPTPLPSVTSLGVVSLHRTDARLALGRELYFTTNWFNGMCCSIGGDVGGVWGQASIKTVVNNRDITGIQATDVVVPNSNDFHSSAVTKGYFFGTSMNLIFPHRTHDFLIGTRVEWQQEFFGKLVDNNDGASQLKLMLEVGWRY